jgi:F0F1-type ATP synthase membrane subunit c/vacuolar-type H+-ATPase subunit K
MRTAALVFVLALLPSAALAKGLNPEAAAAQRAQLEAERSSSPRVAIEQLGSWADEFGDPELFLSAAELAQQEAESSRDLELAQLSVTLALTAQDISSYLADERNYGATDWRPVTRDRAAQISLQAQVVADSSRALVREIEAERAAAEAEAERLRNAPVDEPRTRRPGTGLIAGGSVALVLAGGGIGMLTAGLVSGQARQREAESLMLPAELDRLEQLDSQGATSNALAYAGGAVAGVGIAVGVALIAVGIKRRKAEPSATATLLDHGWLMGGWVDRNGGGLALQGRF